MHEVLYRKRFVLAFFVANVSCCDARSDHWHSTLKAVRRALSEEVNDWSLRTFVKCGKHVARGMLMAMRSLIANSYEVLISVESQLGE
jgi:hypothetical protein